MNNKSNNPKLSSKDLVSLMKNKGIKFEIYSEEDTEKYMLDVNNYFRTTSYRKNYIKQIEGKNKGNYIYLDFAYLKELSTIDMH